VSRFGGDVVRGVALDGRDTLGHFDCQPTVLAAEAGEAKRGRPYP
jgi:hypothetical protein